MLTVQVLVLGTYPMEDPGADGLGLGVDDHLSPARQVQIEHVTALLARYRPDKVLVQAPYGDPEMVERYQRYRAGTYSLSADERDQLGCRLAARLSHPTLYPVDCPDDGFDVEPVLDLARRVGDNRVPTLMEHARRTVEVTARSYPDMTVREILLEENGPAMLALGRAVYNVLLRVHEPPANFLGAEVVSRWYWRNLQIFANVATTLSPQDERVLVLVGAGHAPLLRDLVRDAPDMELVEPERYLAAR